MSFYNSPWVWQLIILSTDLRFGCFCIETETPKLLFWVCNGFSRFEQREGSEMHWRQTKCLLNTVDHNLFAVPNMCRSNPWNWKCSLYLTCYGNFERLNCMKRKVYSYEVAVCGDYVLVLELCMTKSPLQAHFVAFTHYLFSRTSSERELTVLPKYLWCTNLRWSQHSPPIFGLMYWWKPDWAVENSWWHIQFSAEKFWLAQTRYFWVKLMLSWKSCTCSITTLVYLL